MALMMRRGVEGLYLGGHINDMWVAVGCGDRGASRPPLMILHESRGRAMFLDPCSHVPGLS